MSTRRDRRALRAPWLTTKRRKYIYRTATAALILAGTYGLLGPDEVNAWTAFLGVALITGLADANTAPGQAGTSVDE